MSDVEQLKTISLLLSDVDGTLVTRDKRLTPATLAAVKSLEAHGIAFAITSARPPRGLIPFVAALDLKTPLAGFNSGMIVDRDQTVLRQSDIGPAAAASAVSMLAARGIDVWIFSGNDWLIRSGDGPYVAHEQHTIGYGPTIVDSFDAALAAATKIVGVSADARLLIDCEMSMQAAIGAQASVALSQTYYLDITSLDANKGQAVLALSDLLRIPTSAIATIGDMANDVRMFEKSGFSIAMGNAKDAVKARAQVATLTNEEDGFAHAVERFILPRAPR